MSELTDTLEKVIQQAALDGALTTDAVSQFHSLVVERNALKEANEEWEENDVKTKKHERKLVERCDNMQQQILLNAERESELEEREKEITQLECKAEHMEERVKDHQKMVELIFRNSILRKEVMTPAESHTEATGASHSTFSEKNVVDEKTE